MMTRMARVLLADVVTDPISARDVAALVAGSEAGAVVTFSGDVRDHDHGRQVARLEYEGHPTAAAVLAECAAEQKRFLLSRVDELQCDDPERASDQLFELVASTLDHELLFGRFTPTSPVSDVELQRELTDRGLALLGLRRPAVDLDRPRATPASTELHLTGRPVAGDHEDRARVRLLEPSDVPGDGLDAVVPPDPADVHAHAGRD